LAAVAAAAPAAAAALDTGFFNTFPIFSLFKVRVYS
jgi:hypothetical protein